MESTWNDLPIRFDDNVGFACADPPTQSSAVSTFVSHISPARPSPAYDIYWRFAVERQRIFFSRITNHSEPWTTDPILSTHKFTNAYRASDRTSQYLIRNVIYREDLPNTAREVVFRIFLFKVFNRIETWELLESALGRLIYEDYSFEEYDQVLSESMSAGKPIYSSAYIMPPGTKQWGYKKKHRNHLMMIKRMMDDNLPDHIAATSRMQDGYALILNYPTMGEFLAYQLITDINYSEIVDYSEMEFVVPGPGALSGIRKCFLDTGGLNSAEIIRFMADRQEWEFERLNLEFSSLWGRPLQLIDCQNLFCEIDKYTRISNPEIRGTSNRTRIKHRFKPNSDSLTFWYPPKWGLNDLIQGECR